MTLRSTSSLGRHAYERSLAVEREGLLTDDQRGEAEYDQTARPRQPTSAALCRLMGASLTDGRGEAPGAGRRPGPRRDSAGPEGPAEV